MKITLAPRQRGMFWLWFLGGVALILAIVAICYVLAKGLAMQVPEDQVDKDAANETPAPMAIEELEN